MQPTQTNDTIESELQKIEGTEAIASNEEFPVPTNHPKQTTGGRKSQFIIGMSILLIMFFLLIAIGFLVWSNI
jgi:hypothetical protein